MVYNKRNPGELYAFPTLTQEFLRWARAEAKDRCDGTTKGLAIDLSTPSPTGKEKARLRRLLRKQNKLPSTAAQRAEWKLRDAGLIPKKGSKRRRNTSSVESSPTLDETCGRGASGIPPIGDKTSVACVSSPPRSRFLHEIEIEKEDYGDYEDVMEDEADYEDVVGGNGDYDDQAEGEDEQHPPTHPAPQQTTVHIGWITQQADNTFLLEKDFRALRTWFAGPDSEQYDPWQYDLENVKQSLRVQEAAAAGLLFELYWFETLENGPWLIKDVHALAGAVERMRVKRGAVCFFVAANVEHVRALSLSQRALEEQAEQFVVLDIGPDVSCASI